MQLAQARLQDRDTLNAMELPVTSSPTATLLVLDGSSPDEATEGLRLARVVYARNRRSARHAYLMSRAQAANEQPAPAIQTARRALLRLVQRRLL